MNVGIPRESIQEVLSLKRNEPLEKGSEVRMCVFMYVCVFIYVCVCVRVRVRERNGMLENLAGAIFKGSEVRTYICMCVCVYACVC